MSHREMARLQAALARRREAEQIKFERSAAVDRYFDKWGKITSRFEQWTGPDYSKKAEEEFKRRQDQDIKQKALESRRQRLRDLLTHESLQFDAEIKQKQKPKSRTVATNVLEGIKNTREEIESLRRRQELEKQLYQRWRLESDRDQIILESKTDNQAFAKLNWLDRQVEMHLQNNQEKKEAEERRLAIEQAARQREEIFMKQQVIRESQLRELRALQENHLDELKNQEKAADELKYTEVILKRRREEISEELERLLATTRLRRDRTIALYNLRRIKMLLRERSEQIRTHLKQDLAILERIMSGYDLKWDDEDTIRFLKDKFTLQLAAELQKQSYIEAMYESEAKQTLTKQEDVWDQEESLRALQIRSLLEERLMKMDKRLEDCLSRQKELTSMRETHLTAVENINLKVKALMQEQLEEKHGLIDAETKGTKELEEKMNGLHLLEKENVKPQLQIPQFGRRKVAWC